jgi:hypothetical protein
MLRLDKTVFISYRRVDRYAALSVFKELTTHGFDVFIDYDGIASGDFERSILANIVARAHFVVILTPNALDRWDESGDWLRREIEAAISADRNIVPLFMQRFDWEEVSVATQFSRALATLRAYQGLEVPDNYFDEAMARLRNKYLAIPVGTVIHPASSHAHQVAWQQQQVAIEAATGSVQDETPPTPPTPTPTPPTPTPTPAQPQSSALFSKVVVMTGIVAASFITFSWFTSQEVSVPNVVGQKPDAARKLIVGSGLKSRSEEREISDVMQAGLVVHQVPSGNTRARRDSEVVLAIGHIQRVEVPTVVGLNSREAISVLERSGLRGRSVASREDSNPRGTVIEQRPSPNFSALPGRTVDLVISAGTARDPSSPSSQGITGSGQEALLSEAARARIAAIRKTVRQEGPTSATAAAFEKVLWGSNHYSIVVRDNCDPSTIRNALSSVPTSELVVLPLPGTDCYRIAWGLYASEASAKSARAVLGDNRLRQHGSPVDGRVVSVSRGVN